MAGNSLNARVRLDQTQHIGASGTLVSDAELLAVSGFLCDKINAATSGCSEERIFYVGKHGDDANTGRCIEEAFLTIGAAITAVNALGDVSLTNRAAIRVHDGGTYVESFTAPGNCTIDAEQATVVGAITLMDLAEVRLASHSSVAGLGAVVRGAGGSGCRYQTGLLAVNPGTTAGVINLFTTGIMFADIQGAIVVGASGVAGGIGVADLASGGGRTHCEIRDIVLRGTTSIALVCTAAGALLKGSVDRIINEFDDQTTTVGISVGAGASVYLDNDCIHMTNSTAYTVAGVDANLHLQTLDIQGTKAVSAGGSVCEWSPEVLMSENFEVKGQYIMPSSVGSIGDVMTLTTPAVGVTPARADWVTPPVPASGLFHAHIGPAHVASGLIFGTTITVPFDTADIVDPPYEFIANSGVRILENGRYVVNAEVTTAKTAGNQRAESDIGLEVNQALIDGTRRTMYNRNLAQGLNSCAFCKIIELSAGDMLSVVVRHLSGGGTISTVADGSSLTLDKRG